MRKFAKAWESKGQSAATWDWWENLRKWATRWKNMKKWAKIWECLTNAEKV